ncbi:uncharacterized protein LOC143922257 [Arctopsyche grandis]|uniref:uncharacterized protein LOC143922257 n=1 Tax=Arctopsyche grandis TaxID=121162 RepID=UPI00406D7DA3
MNDALWVHSPLIIKERTKFAPFIVHYFSSVDFEHALESDYRIINVILTLAKCNLAFRGHQENFVSSRNPGNFLSFNKLLATYDTLLESLIAKHKAGSMKFNVQLIKESFVGFFNVKDRSTEGLKNFILDLLTSKGLDFAKCRGHGYDGVRVMSGAYNGLQKKITEHEPNAHEVHCATNNLNLVIKDTHFDELSNDTRFQDSLKKFEITIFNAALDVALMQLKVRFTSFNDIISKFAFLQSKNLIQLSDDDLYREAKYLADQYVNDFDKSLPNSYICISSHERLTVTLRFIITERKYENLKYSTIILPQALGQITPETSLFESFAKDEFDSASSPTHTT